jgi:signal transduction histidine kinase
MSTSPTQRTGLHERAAAGFPATIRILSALLLLAPPLGALSAVVGTPAMPASWQLLALCALACVILGLHTALPITRMRLWQQLCCLALQCGMLAAMQLLLPADGMGYLFLAPVIQAVYLFGAWVWVPVAVAVWAMWGGTAIVGRRDWLAWVGENIYAVYVIVAVALAAAIYTYQHRLKAQAEALATRLRAQYASALAALEQAPQDATIEERGRLTLALGGELRAALQRLEQALSGVIAGAQGGVAQAQPLLQQAQGYVRDTADSLRATLAALHPGEEHAPQPSPGALLPTGATVLNAPLLAPAARRVLEWLPLAFIASAPLLVALDQGLSAWRMGTSALFCLLLTAGYGYTLWRRGSRWHQLGLVVQSCTLLAMVLIMQTPALLLGLAVVAAQLALRSSWVQLAAGLAALQGAVGVTTGLLTPEPWQVLGSLLLFALICAALVIPLISARRRFSQRAAAATLLAELESTLGALQERARATRQSAAAAERSRVAREIHDGLGHALMGATLQIRAAHAALGSEPAEALRQLHETRALIVDAQHQLARTVDALSPLPDKPGALREALAALVRGFNQHHSARATLQAEGELDDVPHDVALALLRCAQEGLTNVSRHSGAGEVWLRLCRWPNLVRLSVEDGGGAPANHEPGCGLGLRGLRERATLLGGTLDAAPQPGGGWSLAIELPLAGEAP